MTTSDRYLRERHDVTSDELLNVPYRLMVLTISGRYIVELSYIMQENATSEVLCLEDSGTHRTVYWVVEIHCKLLHVDTEV